MATLTKKAADQIVQEMNDRYQPMDGRCIATPLQMRLLIDKLDEYTKEVQKAASEDVGGFTELKLSDDTDVLQWSSDMAAWQVRLARYRSVVDAVPAKNQNTAAGCKEIYPFVTAPLLDGIYYEILPGIVLSQQSKENITSGTGHTSPDINHPHPAGHSLPGPNDVVTPFSLGNQVLEYKEHQKERFELFWKDLWEEAQNLGGKTKKTLTDVSFGGAPIFVWVAGGAAVVALGYLFFSRPKVTT